MGSSCWELERVARYCKRGIALLWLP